MQKTSRTLLGKLSTFQSEGWCQNLSLMVGRGREFLKDSEWNAIAIHTHKDEFLQTDPAREQIAVSLLTYF